jgi:hypothetical protein
MEGLTLTPSIASHSKLTAIEIYERANLGVVSNPHGCWITLNFHPFMRVSIHQILQHWKRGNMWRIISWGAQQCTQKVVHQPQPVTFWNHRSIWYQKKNVIFFLSHILLLRNKPHNNKTVLKHSSTKGHLRSNTNIEIFEYSYKKY